jgi:hypothetical protein
LLGECHILEFFAVEYFQEGVGLQSAVEGAAPARP